jgi:hypothetical protein
MKLLLDENLPKKLKLDFPRHEVFTVSDMQWNGRRNGELLQLMLENNFQAFLTFDKNLQHQQNLQKYTIIVFVLSAKTNTYIEVSQLTSIVNAHLDMKDLVPGLFVIKK